MVSLCAQSVCGVVTVLSPRFYHVAITCRGDADAFVAPAAMVVPLTAPLLPSSSASSAIKAGSPFGFGYSGMSAKGEPL